MSLNFLVINHQWSYFSENSLSDLMFCTMEESEGLLLVKVSVSSPFGDVKHLYKDGLQMTHATAVLGIRQGRGPRLPGGRGDCSEAGEFRCNVSKWKVRRRAEHF